MPRMSVSKYQRLRTCPRMFYFEDVLYMERVRVGGARDFGGIFHAGLEVWWKSAGQGSAPWADPDVPLVKALRAIAEASKHVDTDKYETAAAEAMMVGYHARWYELEYEVIGGAERGVEMWFEIPLRDPDGKNVANWSLVGKKDAFIQLADRVKPCISEHKHTTQEIAPGSDYWSKLTVDLQPSMYVDAAVQAGYDVASVRYDVSRKPKVPPKRATPEAEREYTIGKGCKDCGGSAKAGEVRKGSGVEYIAGPDGAQEEAPCSGCSGTGWKLNKDGAPEAPRPKADTFLEDEGVLDFKARFSEAIAKNPDAHYQCGDVKRSDAQLVEARADMVAATIEIDAFYARARRATPDGNLRHPLARQQFPRNTAACQRQFGRLCDWLPVCSGQVSPHESQLYRIKQKGRPQ